MEVKQPTPERPFDFPQGKLRPKPDFPPTFAFRPQRQPMFWAALAYALGIIAGHYQWRPTSWEIVACAAFVSAAIYFLHRRIWFAGSLAVGALFLAGALHIQLRGASTQRDNSVQPFTDGREVQIVAHVTRDGRMRVGSFGDLRQSADVEAESVTTEAGDQFPIHSG